MLTRSISVPTFLVTKKTGHMYLNSYDPSQGWWLPGGTECSQQDQQGDKPAKGSRGGRIELCTVGKDSGGKEWHSELWEMLRSLGVMDNPNYKV